MLRTMNCCGWLSSSQVMRNFFPGKSRNAVNKRLRILAKDGFVNSYQPNTTEDQLLRLGKAGRNALIEEVGMDEDDVRITLRPPQQRLHFLAINDIYFFLLKGVEKASGSMHFFARDRELKSLSPNARLIPDALVKFQSCLNSAARMYQFAVEYDAGTENLSLMIQKLKLYRECLTGDNSLFGFNQFKILVITSTMRRLASVAKAAMRLIFKTNILYFAPYEVLLQSGDIDDKVFFESQELAKADQRMALHSVLELGLPAGSPSVGRDSQDVSPSLSV